MDLFARRSRCAQLLTINWDTLVDRAAKAHATRMLALGLRLVEEFSDVPVPIKFSSSVDPDTTMQRMAAANSRATLQHVRSGRINRNQSLQPAHHGPQTRRTNLRAALDLRSHFARLAGTRAARVAALALLRVSPAETIKGLHHFTLAQATHSEIAMLKPPLKWAGGKRWLVVAPQANLGSEHRATIRRTVLRWSRGRARLAAKAGVAERRQSPSDKLLSPRAKWFANARADAQRRGAFLSSSRSIQSADSKGKAHTEEGAQLFYYLNRTCFNGLCRFNKSGDFNVPFGTYKAINYAKDFSSYASVFSQWEFSNLDIEALEFEPERFCLCRSAV